jgi:hypothetical protein
MNKEAAIMMFKEKSIRRTWHNEEWWFVITDVIQALTDSVDPAGYFKDMRRRDPELSKGGGKLPPPFGLRLPAASKKLTVLILKESYALSNRFLRLRPNLLSVG